MTVNHHPKVAVHAVKSSSDALASQGARRATEEASASVPPQAACATDTEVVPHARRRQFSNADKRRRAPHSGCPDRCTRPGEVGALMPREGVYSSSVSDRCAGHNFPPIEQRSVSLGTPAARQHDQAQAVVLTFHPERGMNIY